MDKQIIKLHQYYNLSIDDICGMYPNIPDAKNILESNGKMNGIHTLYNMTCGSSFNYEAELNKEIEHKTKPVTIVSTIQCRKCKEYKVITYEKQTRRADEATTVFKICWNCSHTEKC